MLVLRWSFALGLCVDSWWRRVVSQQLPGVIQRLTASAQSTMLPEDALEVFRD